jgi:uncharacterized protein YbbC (DUF1343 family)
MPHNRAYRGVFRFRSGRGFWRAACLALLCAALPAWSSGAPRPNSSSPAPGRVKTGVDILEEQEFAPLRGKRVGLITNQTGVDAQGRRTIDVLAHAPGLKLVALFSPEHGLLGRADAPVGDATDAATGLPVYSLYGATRRPTDAMLQNVDALVFDMQDAGVRFYTYVTTMAYCMEEATKHHIPFFVLDRPDPLGGEVIEGPVLDADRTSFTGYFPLPVRYAMTLGELARLFNAENRIGADLHVVAMRGWRRRDSYDRIGLAWIPPSPNLRTLDAALLYPGIEILQAGGVSVGRGTDAPFELAGAPWIAADDLAAALTRRRIPGVGFTAATFVPNQDAYAGQPCHGVRVRVTSRGSLRPMRVGLEMAAALQRMYPEHFQLAQIVELLGSRAAVERIGRGDTPVQIIAGWSAELGRFRRMRARYLLYD